MISVKFKRRKRWRGLHCAVKMGAPTAPQSFIFSNSVQAEIDMINKGPKLALRDVEQCCGN